eukprot:CAMPEP_0115158478 /NCGR_PEP_ID=MMETSP0227-20121206/69619_1 /TAXON_ID=89957 /ORGANISM="Polarella glacialis, Strain CCMP 1383" /LENGTH=38 /DNA_ID= /DNA_START= /DNA_END= /DNA_ORIENTATION=
MTQKNAQKNGSQIVRRLVIKYTEHVKATPMRPRKPTRF